MKKLFLLTAVSTALIGLAQTSQAGVHVGVGFGFSLPTVVVSRPAPVFVAPAPVCVAQAPVAVCAPAPVIVAEPCPPIVVREPVCYPVYHRGYYLHDGWGHFHGYRR